MSLAEAIKRGQHRIEYLVALVRSQRESAAQSHREGDLDSQEHFNIRADENETDMEALSVLIKVAKGENLEGVVPDIAAQGRSRVVGAARPCPLSESRESEIRSWLSENGISDWRTYEAVCGDLLEGVATLRATLAEREREIERLNQQLGAMTARAIGMERNDV